MNKTEAERRFNIFFIIKNSNKILLSFFLLLTLSCSGFMQKKNRSEKTFPEIYDKLEAYLANKQILEFMQNQEEVL